MSQGFYNTDQTPAEAQAQANATGHAVLWPYPDKPGGMYFFPKKKKSVISQNPIHLPKDVPVSTAKPYPAAAVAPIGSPPAVNRPMSIWWILIAAAALWILF